MLHRTSRSGLGLSLCLLLIACDTQQPAQKPVAQPQPLKKVDVLVDDPDTKLTLSNLGLAPAKSYVKMFKDLRPYWTVTGRIQNQTMFPMRNVRLQAHMVERDTNVEADSTVFELSQEIPANSTVSFAQAIQIQPPAGHLWRWECGVVEAHTDDYK
jgi:hypothetical protein